MSEHRGTSRRGFLKGSVIAGAGALAAQGGMAAAQEAQADAPAEVHDFDVVVVGAGAAGLWAALEAHAGGAKVALLEKQNTSLLSGCALCGGAIVGSATKGQSEAGIEDDPEAHFRDHMRISRMTADPEISRAYCEGSGEVVDWFIDRGVEMQVVPWVLNHKTTVGRAHWTDNRGVPWVEALEAELKETTVEIFYETPGRELVFGEDGSIAGIMAVNADGQKIQFNAKAVVLCTGGFPNNPEMLTRYGFALSEGIPGCPGATGDGINMGLSAGALVKDMEWGMDYYWLKGNILGGMIPGEMVMVNADGKRFVGEHSGYMLVLPRVHDQPDGVVWAVFGSEVVAAKGYTEEQLQDAEAKGFLLKADTIEDLGHALLVDPIAFVDTIAAYNDGVEAGEDKQFGKPAEQLVPIAEPPFYAARVWTPKPTLTYGGLIINTEAEVLDAKRDAIPGLYAAGDDTAGALGRYYPGSGSAIGSAMVMGRIAGRNAATFAVGGLG